LDPDRGCPGDADAGRVLGPRGRLVRTKNSINVAAMNVADFITSSVIFWLFGFALVFGLTGNSWMGWDGFASRSFCSLKQTRVRSV